MSLRYARVHVLTITFVIHKKSKEKLFATGSFGNHTARRQNSYLLFKHPVPNLIILDIHLFYCMCSTFGRFPTGLVSKKISVSDASASAVVTICRQPSLTVPSLVNLSSLIQQHFRPNTLQAWQILIGLLDSITWLVKCHIFLEILSPTASAGRICASTRL